MKISRLQNYLAIALVCCAAGAQAQNYPVKPIRLVVPYAAAGSYDPLMRSAANVLQRQVGQPVIVENRTGGDLIVGAQAVLNAPSDGYTLFAPGASITTWKIFNRNAPIDAVRDFLPVIEVIDVTGGSIVINSGLPARTLREFIAYAKANPGKINYGHASRTLMLVTEWIKQVAGIDMVAVPYKGGSEVLNAVLGNNVQFVLDSPGNYVQHANAGRVRILAALGKDRAPSIPNVPSTEEEGVKGIVYSNWLGILVNNGTPQALIARLNSEWASVLKNKEFMDMNEKIFGGSGRLVGGTPEEFGRLIESEQKRWSEVAAKANIQPE